MSYYAVHQGVTPGVYTTWDSCKSQITGYSGAKYKKFKTRIEAEYFVKHGESKPVASVKTNGIDTYFGVKKIIDLQSSSDDDGGDDDGADDGDGNSDKNNQTIIYTDGSLIRKNGVCWAGYGVYIPSSNQRLSYILEAPKTNNRAELLAIITAMELSPEGSKLEIYTDSQYSIYICTGTGLKYQKQGFQTRDRKSKKMVDVINRDLIERVLLLLPKYEMVFHHVRAHTGLDDEHSRGNDVADLLAVKGATMDMLQSYSDLATYPISFGKYQGKVLGEIPRSYLQWTQTDSGFEAQCQRDELKRMEGSIIAEYLGS